MHVIGIFLEHLYWPTMIAAAKEKRPVAPFAGFTAQAVSSVPETELKTWVAAALKQVTSNRKNDRSWMTGLSCLAMDGVVSPERPDRRRIPDEKEKNVLNVTRLLSC